MYGVCHRTVLSFRYSMFHCWSSSCTVQARTRNRTSSLSALLLTTAPTALQSKNAWILAYCYGHLVSHLLYRKFRTATFVHASLLSSFSFCSYHTSSMCAIRSFGVEFWCYVADRTALRCNKRWIPPIFRPAPAIIAPFWFLREEILSSLKFV